VPFVWAWYQTQTLVSPAVPEAHRAVLPGEHLV